MNPKNTICYKIDIAVEELNKALKTALSITQLTKSKGTLTDEEFKTRLREIKPRGNPLAITNLLHEIRDDAQSMENGLKRRKKIMKQAGFEEEYQKQKKKFSKGISFQRDEQQILTPNTEQASFLFEITIKDRLKDEIVYHKDATAAVVSITEKINDIDTYGVIDGESQTLYFGESIAIFYAFDQLRIGMEAKMPEILLRMQQLVISGKITDPETKRILMNTTNISPIVKNPIQNSPQKPGRNDLCFCGSNKKYKKCHLNLQTIL